MATNDAHRLSMIHPLDHLVLPTTSLELARARLTALGFTVAPTGVHPFGTENCCVYFSNDTFMEPLAVNDAGAIENAVAAGNAFVARDQFYRARYGQEGLSAVVFGTDDAEADHRRYVDAGVSAGDRLDFSRPFTDASGKQDTASFRLAFAAGSDRSGTFLFSCERANMPTVDRTTLQAHENSACAIVEVIAVSMDPVKQHTLLAVAAGAEVSNVTSASGLALANARLTILEPNQFESRIGFAISDPSDLRFAAVVFAVANLERLKALFVSNGINYNMSDSQIVVAPAPGQGAVFIFEERT